MHYIFLLIITLLAATLASTPLYSRDHEDKIGEAARVVSITITLIAFTLILVMSIIDGTSL